MKDFIILIPPSEGKTPGGGGPAIQKVSKDVKPIVEKLQQVNISEWPKLLGVKGKALESAVQANQSILTSETLSAIERYSGVVYDGLDYASLNSKAQRYIDQRVGIVSALFGLVRPKDLIPVYKLKIDKLGADKYWQPILSKKLKGQYVIDLLPKAHKKAVAYDDGSVIEFCILKNGKIVPAGHNGKLIKGRFVRWLAENQIENLSDIKRFKQDGYQWQDGKFIKKG